MANQPTPLAVADAENWAFQQSYIERLMDNSALTTAHPDDTLILAGPPRHLSADAQFFKRLLPLGMIQNMQITQQKPTTPMQAIGSGRLFFISGKAQGQSSIARLFVNGRNLLRALYTNAIQAGIDVTQFDDPAAQPPNKLAQFFANLDSELFLIPFGLAVFFRDKVHNDVGSFYLELCMINTWAIGVGAGQNMIMENVNMMFDRLKPISAGAIGQAASTYNYSPASPNTGKLIKTIFQQDTAEITPGGPSGNARDEIARY